MNKFIKLLLILVIVFSFLIADTKEEIQAEKIYSEQVVKAECRDLYEDYKFFRKKALQSRDGTIDRWFKISEEYKRRYFKCNTTRTISAGENKKKYYTPNPYNKIK